MRKNQNRERLALNRETLREVSGGRVHTIPPYTEGAGCVGDGPSSPGGGYGGPSIGGPSGCVVCLSN